MSMQYFDEFNFTEVFFLFNPAYELGKLNLIDLQNYK